MIKLLLIFFLTLVTFYATSQMDGVTKRNGEFVIPPGNVRVDSNLFFDQHETTNFNWQEYLYHLGRDFGKTSPEYTAALPDTNIWSRIDNSLIPFSTHYLKHPSYQNYPVVGISYKQAKAYAQWRSDRVFQYYLIREKVIPMSRSNALDSAFTIEKYLSGNYLNYEPDSNYLTYPHFELIDTASYKILSHFADSVNQINLKHCKKDSLASVKLLGNYYEYFAMSHPEYLQARPTLAVSCKCRLKKMIPHLYGNVSELTAQEGIIFGSGYGDSTTIKTPRPFTNEQLSTTLIGFRSKCSFRTWPN